MKKLRKRLILNVVIICIVLIAIKMVYQPAITICIERAHSKETIVRITKDILERYKTILKRTSSHYITLDKDWKRAFSKRELNENLSRKWVFSKFIKVRVKLREFERNLKNRNIVDIDRFKKLRRNIDIYYRRARIRKIWDILEIRSIWNNKVGAPNKSTTDLFEKFELVYKISKDKIIEKNRPPIRIYYAARIENKVLAVTEQQKPIYNPGPRDYSLFVRFTGKTAELLRADKKFDPIFSRTEKEFVKIITREETWFKTKKGSKIATIQWDLLRAREEQKEKLSPLYSAEDPLSNWKRVVRLTKVGQEDFSF